MDKPVVGAPASVPVSPEVAAICEKMLVFLSSYETQLQMNAAAGVVVVKTKHRQIIGDEREVYIPMNYLLKMVGQYMAVAFAPEQVVSAPSVRV